MCATGRIINESNKNTEHIMDTTLIQLAAFVTESKLSGYSQSVEGQLKQHEVVGDKAVQNRPSRSTVVSQGQLTLNKGAE